MPRGRPRKNVNNVLFKSAEMIGWALGGIEREIAATRDRLTALTSQANQLRARMGGGVRRGRPPVAAPTFDEPNVTVPRRRRKMSAEARKRISELMKKRWAERRRQGKTRL